MIQSGNSEYSIVSDREIASVIGNFSSGMVMNTLHNILNDPDRLRYFSIGNLVNAYETDYKVTVAQHPDLAQDLAKARIDTYEAIINKLCDHFHLSVNLNGNMDLYSVASNMYQFLVAEFPQNVVNFYYNLMLREKNNLYHSYDLEALKKAKDSSTIYSRKVYKTTDNKLWMIHTNLDTIITDMYAQDISLEQVLELCYANNKVLAKFLSSFLLENHNFYQSFIIPFMNGVNRASTITHIRLQLQPMIMDAAKSLLQPAT